MVRDALLRLLSHTKLSKISVRVYQGEDAIYPEEDDEGEE